MTFDLPLPFGPTTDEKDCDDIGGHEEQVSTSEYIGHNITSA